uniref:Uncharacterized protein n=1 Tax=Xiphophorus maculatus TaxID=8083 RepID=A0A3B5QBX2_XIPMA
MGKKRWTTAEIILTILFILMTILAVTMIALFVTKEPDVISEGKLRNPREVMQK